MSASIQLLRLPPPQRTIAEEAARSALGDVSFYTVEELAQLPDPPEAEELVVFATTGYDGQPLDTVPGFAWHSRSGVALGSGAHPAIEYIDPAEWTPPVLSRVFRSRLALRRSGLRSERMRNDLLTIARRIHHDFRSPLGSIQTSAEVLREAIPSSEDVIVMVDIVRQSAEEMAQLMERITLVLRATAEPSEPETIGMAEPVTAALASVQSRLDAIQATVITPSDWPRVSGVRSWIVLIWLSFLENAIRHAGERVRLQLAWQSADPHIQFSITDNGVGVPSNQLKQIFTPFEQLHHRPARGLSLSIVRRLVELQGGTCSFAAPSIGGASFSFTLPAA